MVAGGSLIRLCDSPAGQASPYASPVVPVDARLSLGIDTVGANLPLDSNICSSMLFDMELPSHDEHAPEDWEQIRRSVAMLSPGAWALTREDALEVLRALVACQRQPRS